MKKFFFAAAAALLIFVGSASAEVIDRVSGEFRETLYTEADMICEAAALYDQSWAVWGDAFGFAYQLNGGAGSTPDGRSVNWIVFSNATSFEEADSYVVVGYLPDSDEVCILATAVRLGEAS